MQKIINRERLADVFTTLCEIDSPSKKEARIAAFLKKTFHDLGADSIIEDDSAALTGSDSGNLLVRFAGDQHDIEPVFFNCHMDTVHPGEGVRVRRQGDVFTSAGETILGADDKSGIAVFIETMRTLRENRIPHGPVEFLFTTCEEVGLLGVKAFQFPLIRAQMGYVFDTSGIDRVVIGAPAANRLAIEITGASAHAGLNPENGINAIQLAAIAIASLHLGRLDDESTANIGLISGGTATNIIPDQVAIAGEVRSHSETKLAAFTREMEEAFNKMVAEWTVPARGAVQPKLIFTVNQEYPVMRIDRNAPVIQRVEKAATALSRTLRYEVAGGGSDANIFNHHGLPCAIIGTGMNKVHTTEETICLDDMVRTAEVVISILTTLP